MLTLNAPIATKVVCFSRLLKCLRSLYGKQCGPRSDCLFWVQPVCFYTLFVSNVRQLFAADDFSRRHFQVHLFSWRFNGETSTKQRLKRLAQGHNTVTEARTSKPSIPGLTLYQLSHCTPHYICLPTSRNFFVILGRGPRAFQIG